MGLSAALQIGRSGLLDSQSAIEVTGNNLATRGYHRRTVSFSPTPGQEIQDGVFVRRGVQLQAITRRIDEAMEARLRGAVVDQSRSLARQDLLHQIESIHNEFSDVDLSTRLSSFFNVWSQLANNPQDISLRALVTSEGSSLAQFIQNLHGELTTMRSLIDRTAQSATDQVNRLLDGIEELNRRIVLEDRGSGGASGLRDQRNAALSELSRYLDISTVEHANESLDVFVGSLSIVPNRTSRGVELQTKTVNGQLEIDLVIADDKSPLDLSGGELGAMVEFRQKDLTESINTLDLFTNEFIFQVNRLHSQGHRACGF